MAKRRVLESKISADLKAMISFARSNGLTRLKVGDIEFDVGPKPTRSSKRASALSSIPSEKSPTEEELLFYSAGPFIPSETNPDDYQPGTDS